MNILLTGATGFIGQNLLSNLLKEGHNCRCLLRSDNMNPDLLKRKNIEIVLGDITDKKSLRNICKDIDYVYHLAAIMGHDLPSQAAFDKFRRVNVVGTKNLLEECLNSDIKKFIYCSSTAAMGLLNQKIVDETSICKPYTPYQVSKYEGELIVQDYIQKYKLPAVIVRPSMVYGPGFKGDFLTIAKVVKTGFFPKIGTGDNLSPALYIDDLINVLTVVKEKAKVGEIYLISSEESYKLDDIVRIIAEELNVKIRKIYAPVFLAKSGAWLLEKVFTLAGKTPVVTFRNIKSTVTDRIFNVNKAVTDLDFQQKISIDQGLINAVRYFKSENLL